MSFESEVVIGMEIHVSLNTRNKLFCSCKNETGTDANSNICPVCLGHPGSRPILNREAVIKAMRLASALDFKIIDRLLFSRKTYFYPDLAKNYQITQYEEPLGSDGKITVEGRDIGIERLHIEEDPGSIRRKDKYSLIDYNRSGTPLCEIVTEPEITSAEEARKLLRKLILIMRYLDVWDKSSGNLKADLNISIRETEYKKVEIKGVSGLREIESALDYEIKRQKDSPDSVKMETRLFDPENSVTVSMRDKESEEDYGYIYEPDVVPRKISEDLKKKVRDDLPELYDSRVRRYTSKGLEHVDAEAIASIPELSYIFDLGLDKGIDPVKLSRFFKKELIYMLNDGKINESDISSPDVYEPIFEVVSLLFDRKINNHSARSILEKISKNVEERFDVLEWAESNSMIVGDDLDLDSISAEVIKENPGAVSDYNSGKYWAINFLVGQVMKKVKGKAMPDEVKSKLKEKLSA